MNEKKICETGIKELDRLLGGGIPQRIGVLVAGGPGTGKTILCQEFLFRGVEKFNENGVYLDLTEVREKLIENIETFKFYKREYLDNGKIRILDIQSTDKIKKSFFTGPGERTKMLGHSFASMIKDIVEESKAKRLVIDSLTAIYEKFDNPADMRAFVFELLSSLSNMECTTLFISEILPYQHRYSISGIEEFMLDGIIYLSDYESKNNLERTLQIIKMRGTRHSRVKNAMMITENGIVLTPIMT
jgi:KaiC/GvpD/RAD55 family RecA-like ATPase